MAIMDILPTRVRHTDFMVRSGSRGVPLSELDRGIALATGTATIGTETAKAGTAAATGGAGEEISHATGWDTAVTSVEAKASGAVEAEVIIMAAAAEGVATVPGNLRSHFQVITKPNGCQTGVLQPFGFSA